MSSANSSELSGEVPGVPSSPARSYVRRRAHPLSGKVLLRAGNNRAEEQGGRDGARCAIAAIPASAKIFR